MKSPPNFERTVLGCISKPIFASTTRVKALDEIYKICRLLHRSDLNISAKKVARIATVSCPNFHFSVSPHVPFLNLLFEQIANSNAYLLAKFGFDTAENEPFKVRALGS